MHQTDVSWERNKELTGDSIVGELHTIEHADSQGDEYADLQHADIPVTHQNLVRICVVLNHFI